MVEKSLVEEEGETLTVSSEKNGYMENNNSFILLTCLIVLTSLLLLIIGFLT